MSKKTKLNIMKGYNRLHGSSISIERNQTTRFHKRTWEPNMITWKFMVTLNDRTQEITFHGSNKTKRTMIKYIKKHGDVKDFFLKIKKAKLSPQGLYYRNLFKKFAV